MLSDEGRILAGILLLSLVTVETGGLYMLKIVRGKAEVTPFQEKFARAGHAHAGRAAAARPADPGRTPTRPPRTGSSAGCPAAGWPCAALVMPGGFFFSSMGAGRTRRTA